MAVEEHTLDMNNNRKVFRLFLKGGDGIVASLTANSAETNLLSKWQSAREAAGTFQLDISQEIGHPVAILLQQLDGVTLPEELAEQGLDDEQLTSQFQSRLIAERADVIVLSLLPEITAELWQRRESGYLLAPPPNWEQIWSPDQREWFQSHFVPLGQADAARFQADFGRLLAVLQDKKEAQVIVCGVSSYDPADTGHNYHAAAETRSLRAHRFNHALIQLSEKTGVVVLDVDRLIAEMGGSAHIKQVFRYSAEANKLIGQALLGIIEALGYFDEHPLLRLAMPQLSQQFQSGSIVKWHVRPGKWVNEGDSLMDFRVEEFTRLKRTGTDAPDQLNTVEVSSRDWNWLVRVTAVDKGFFQKRVIAEKESCAAGDLLAVFSLRDNERIQFDEADVASAPIFRAVANILETADQETGEQQSYD